MGDKPLYQRMADLYAGYLDQPNDPAAKGTLRSDTFQSKFLPLAPPWSGYRPSDFGFLQMNPQYRGIRMVLPQSGGSYGAFANQAGGQLAEQGFPRQTTEGPIGEPDPLDPHRNNVLRYPPNSPPDQGGLREEVYGELIRRGYPVLGGTGDFGGEFQPGFNPVGFGQRAGPSRIPRQGKFSGR